MDPDGVDCETLAFQLGGFVRRYVMLRRRGSDPREVPTIVDLHGSGSWPEEHAAITAARSLAALGVIVVVPQAGIPFRLLAEWPAGWAWNVPGSPLPGETTPRAEPDDLAFVGLLVTRLIETHGVDPSRIHVRGFSGGARLASHLMATMPSRLASVCAVGGIRFVTPVPGALPPLLAIHGGLDVLNPHQGGSGPRWAESVEAVVDRWAAASGCAPTAQRLDTAEVHETRFVDAMGFGAVRLIMVADAAHSWPGTAHADHLAQFGASGNFKASQAHWDFVREVEHL
jgi:polyhydroxybutyrate depolymerase